MATTKTYTFINSQPADATQVNKNFDDLLAGINADVSATDKVLGRATAGAGPVEEISCTPFARTVLDDVDAAAQRATLGAVGTGDSRLSDARVASDVSAWAKAASKPTYTAAEVGYSEGTWTPALNSFTIVGAAPAVSGTYKRIGNLIFSTVLIAAGTGGNTSVAIAQGTSYISGIPVNPAISAPVLLTVDGNPATTAIGTLSSIGRFGFSNVTAMSNSIHIVCEYGA